VNIFVNDLLRRIVPFSTVQPDADSPPATFRTTLHGAQTDTEHPAERAHAFAALILMEYLFFDFLGIVLHTFFPAISLLLSKPKAPMQYQRPLKTQKTA